MTKEYLFGDTDVAAQRLKLLADVFAASSRVFIIEAANPDPRLALDLGCGPGHTTHLLADTLDPERTVGLDNSEHFVGLAAKTATNNVSFLLHDVTSVPFPLVPCDLIYSRFLLTHQPDPETLMAKWASQLCPAGRLLLEEVDSIHTQTPAFVEYIQIVEKMLADDGYDLYVGQKLDASPTPNGLLMRSSRTLCLPVTSQAAARMFSMNIQTWKNNAFVRQNYSLTAIQKLEQDLLGLTATPTNDIGVEWTLRQLVYEREN